MLKVKLMQTSNSTCNKGFTLVEMAVVLAIIGILVGGVVAGQYAIRQSQLQGVVVDLTKFKSAYAQFKSQYEGMPGDILDATDYWGTDTTGACPTGTRVPKKETCNGNGDNYIGSVDGWTTWSEPFRAWQQLSNAGYIEGTFSGVAGTGGEYATTIGTNVPKGKLSNTGYTLYTETAKSSDANWFDMAQSQIIIFGSQNGNLWTNVAALIPREQANIDTKMDDGKPGLGAMMSYKTTVQANCATGDTTAATYKLSYTNPACSIIYVIDQ